MSSTKEKTKSKGRQRPLPNVDPNSPSTFHAGWVDGCRTNLAKVESVLRERIDGIGRVGGDDLEEEVEHVVDIARLCASAYMLLNIVDHARAFGGSESTRAFVESCIFHRRHELDAFRVPRRPYK
jgi:hypothetical protein